MTDQPLTPREAADRLSHIAWGDVEVRTAVRALIDLARATSPAPEGGLTVDAVADELARMTGSDFAPSVAPWTSVTARVWDAIERLGGHTPPPEGGDLAARPRVREGEPYRVAQAIDFVGVALDESRMPHPDMVRVLVRAAEDHVDRLQADALTWTPPAPSVATPPQEALCLPDGDSHDGRCQECGDVVLLVMQTHGPVFDGTGDDESPCAGSHTERWEHPHARPSVATPQEGEESMLCPPCAARAGGDGASAGDPAKVFRCPTCGDRWWESTPAAEQATMDALREVEKLTDVADRLAAAIAPPEVLGEHSSANDPWRNALDHAALRPAPAPLAVGDPVKTVEQLDSLPVGSVVRGPVSVGQRDPYGWQIIGISGHMANEARLLPARVLDLRGADSTGGEQ